MEEPPVVADVVVKELEKKQEPAVPDATEDAPEGAAPANVPPPCALC